MSAGDYNIVRYVVGNSVNSSDPSGNNIFLGAAVGAFGGFMGAVIAEVGAGINGRPIEPINLLWGTLTGLAIGAGFGYYAPWKLPELGIKILEETAGGIAWGLLFADLKTLGFHWNRPEGKPIEGKPNPPGKKPIEGKPIDDRPNIWVPAPGLLDPWIPNSGMKLIPNPGYNPRK